MRERAEPEEANLLGETQDNDVHVCVLRLLLWCICGTEEDDTVPISACKEVSVAIQNEKVF